MKQRIQRALKIIEHVCQVQPERWFAFFETLSQAELRAHQSLIIGKVASETEFHFQQFLASSEQAFSIDCDALIDCYWAAGQKLVAQITDVRELILREKDAGRYIIGEFGQAFWLDKRHGFPPNVTASHTFTLNFFSQPEFQHKPFTTLAAKPMTPKWAITFFSPKSSPTIHSACIYAN